MGTDSESGKIAGGITNHIKKWPENFGVGALIPEAPLWGK